jgi:hypothetical protein
VIRSRRAGQRAIRDPRARGSGRALLSLVSAALLLVSLALTDWQADGIRRFWAEHAMLTNLLSSAVFVVVGFTFVDRWLKRREARRLRLVIAVAFASVGRFLLAYRRVMWFLLYGGEFLGDPDFRVTDAQVAALRKILFRHGLSEVDEHVAVQDDEACSASRMQDRLQVLAGDLEWVRLAYDLLRDTFFRSRIVLSRWASLLVTTEVSSAALQEMAEQAYDLGDLFVQFRDHIRREHPAAFDPAAVPGLVLQWRMVFTNTVALYWRLAHLTGQQSRPWPTDGRNLLLPIDREALDTPRRRGPAPVRPYGSLASVRPWSPPPEEDAEPVA